jgi:hypothetical protein
MVPLGDPRSFVDPFEIDCQMEGAGRWIDSRTWVYDFTRDLPGGLRCRFQLRTGLATQAGKSVIGRATFAFTTGGTSHPGISPQYRLEHRRRSGICPRAGRPANGGFGAATCSIRGGGTPGQEIEARDDRPHSGKTPQTFGATARRSPVMATYCGRGYTRSLGVWIVTRLCRD